MLLPEPFEMRKTQLQALHTKIPPPEQQMQLEQLRQTNPDQYEQAVKQMMMQGGGGDAMHGMQPAPYGGQQPI